MLTYLQRFLYHLWSFRLKYYCLSLVKITYILTRNTLEHIITLQEKHRISKFVPLSFTFLKY